MKRTTGLSGAVLALILCGCSAAETDTGQVATPTVASSSSASTSAAAPSTTTRAPASAARAASCGDPRGDGEPADLTSVKLVEESDGLQATFALAKTLNTSTGTAQLSLQVSSQDGETARQLGARWVDGQVKVFVFDSGTARNEYVDTAPILTGATVAVTFPRTAIDGLGDTWRWTATTSTDGTDADVCPEPGDDVLNPERQTFPG